MNNLFGLFFLILFGLCISSCSNQRYAYRKYVRMEAKETMRDPHLKPAATIHPKDFSPQTLERIAADTIDWQSSTIQERKEQASTAIAEREHEQVPAPDSISKPRQSIARSSTPITTLAFKKKSSNLEIKEITGIWLSLLLIVLGFLLFGIAGLLLLVGLGGSGYLGLFVIAGLFLLSGSILFIKSIYDSFHEDGELKGKRSNYVLFSILLLVLIIGLSLVTVNLPLIAFIISYFAALFLIATLITAIFG